MIQFCLNHLSIHVKNWVCYLSSLLKMNFSSKKQIVTMRNTIRAVVSNSIYFSSYWNRKCEWCWKTFSFCWHESFSTYWGKKINTGGERCIASWQNVKEKNINVHVAKTSALISLIYTLFDDICSKTKREILCNHFINFFYTDD